jgi:hypothetical protein
VAVLTKKTCVEGREETVGILIRVLFPLVPRWLVLGSSKSNESN